MALPIILIGMHRSGTSLLVRLLEQAGLFVGRKLSVNHEAFFFQYLNEQLMESTGARWDHPGPFQALLIDKPVRDLTVAYLVKYVRSYKNFQFMGLRKKLRYGNPYQIPIPWGWKDPRNTFTLPLWLDLFPNAKVVHIYRHGVDVAHSLKTRVENNLAASKAFVAGEGKRRRRWRLGKGLVNSIHCRTIEGGLNLWESYISEAQKHVNVLGDRALEIKYEDFLENPEPVFAALVDFCNLSVSEGTLSQLVGGVNPSRAYAFKRSDELVAFATQEQQRLARFGY